MPSMQDALAAAIAAKRFAADTAPKELPADWDDEGGDAPIEETQTTPVNATRATHAYIAANPGAARADVIDAVAAQGCNRGTITAVITQMLAQGLLRAQDRHLWVINQEYRPVKSGTVLAAERKAEAAAALHAKRVENLKKARAARAANIQTKRVESRKKPKHVPLEVKKAAIPQSAPAPAWTPEMVLNGLPVLQARALYDELKKLFGA